MRKAAKHLLFRAGYTYANLFDAHGQPLSVSKGEMLVIGIPTILLLLLLNR